jgi:hypothetical protein
MWTLVPFAIAFGGYIYRLEKLAKSPFVGQELGQGWD